MSRLAEAIPRRLDLRLLLAPLALTLSGILMIASTSAETGLGKLGTRQLLFFGIGLLVVLVLTSIDYRLLLQYSVHLYTAGLLLLVLVLVVGSRIAGAKSWIRLPGGLSFQPSEFTRLSTALLLAWILEKDDRALLRPRTLLLLGIAVGLPTMLVGFQPDLGVALTYVPFLLAAFFFGGLKTRVWAILVLTAVLAAGGSWFLLKEYQKERIRTFLDPERAAQGAGYQVRQARIAIGSGGLFGKGWRQGTQSRLGFLPVRHTDFVFAALAEEWGLIGVGAVIGFFGLFLSRAFTVARDARDRGGAMLVLLLVVNLAVEAVVNISMNIGLVPTTGITLPFVSYGGSSLIACWGAVGLCLSVAYRRFVNV